MCNKHLNLIQPTQLLWNRRFIFLSRFRRGYRFLYFFLNKKHAFLSHAIFTRQYASILSPMFSTKQELEDSTKSLTFFVWEHFGFLVCYDAESWIEIALKLHEIAVDWSHQVCLVLQPDVSICLHLQAAIWLIWCVRVRSHTHICAANSFRKEIQRNHRGNWKVQIR